jgi:hypothetical protein
MNGAPRRILIFALQFVPLFAVCLWLYVLLLPRYERLVVGAASTLTERLSRPTELAIEPGGLWQSYVFTPEGGRRPLQRWDRTVAYVITLSLAVFPAMLLATPAPLSTRLRLFVAGLILLFVVHVLSIVGLMRGTFCLEQRPGNFLCLSMLRLVYTSGQLLGAAVWAGLSWRYWFPTAGFSGKRGPT